jgi:hypothetical protein
MFYKPTYCCHCGEKIDRAKWKITDSRRFCESCASEFTFKEWIPRAIVFIGIIGALFGFGALLRKTEKPLSVSAPPSSAVSTNAARNQKSPQFLSNANVQNSGAPSMAENAAANNAAMPQAQKQNPADPKSPENLRLQTADKSAGKQKPATEAVYFCGAQTKKGTPCSRRVKGGGRCWQHAGQAAMLPPEKLLISQ